ncbi:MAG: sulfatase-like hydrolase/transferase [Lentisphaeria bacterium]|nr:sulfatase-like hydrolase/transferase [Lentisphaeria bacterium]
MPAQPLNILLIHTDQHRFDCLGATGNPDVQTPNIDALAASGVVFDNSFCPYPVCTPSRYSLLTGLYVHQHLGWTNHCTVPNGLPALPRLLRDAGWNTAAVGKMHFTPTYLDLGFTTMRLAEQNGPGRYDDDYHRWLAAEAQCPCVDLMDQEREYRSHATAAYWDRVGALESDLDEAHHSTTWVAEQALEQLRSWSGGGNLLMAGFVKPHHPFDPPAPWSRLYDPEALTLLPGWLETTPDRDLGHNRGYFPHAELSEAKVRGAMAMYYATISQIDHHVGRMVEALRAGGHLDRTLIVVTSDHGEYLGFHHLLLKANHMYDPLVKVPLILRWPDGRRAGQRDPRLVSNVDLAPTLLRAAGLAVPRSLPGLDLERPGAERPVVFCEDRHGSWYMARSHTRKLLQGPDRCLLFDLTRDPDELQDVSESPEYARDRKELREALARWMLFESPTPTHLDEWAPVIPAPNAPDRRDAHRLETAEVFRRRMTRWGVPPEGPTPFTA